MGAGYASRQAALDVLRGVRSGRVWDSVLAEALDGLQPDDAGLAHEIAAGVLRSRRRLDAELAELAADWSNTSDDLRDLLRIGAFQLVVLDRVPRYAAVQATVEAAKRTVGTRGSRFVNAMLRRFADRADALTSPGDPRETHPDWLVARWTDRFGEERALQLLAHNDRRPSLTLIPYRWTQDRLAEALAEHDIDFWPATIGRGLVTRTVRVSTLPGYSEGAFIVQDAAQNALLEFADLDVAGYVWDACAAPGGKALRLAQDHQVLASDVRLQRAHRVEESARRCRASVSIAVADGREPPFTGGAFEAVLVDAPCTATGTMQRHPDARWRLVPTMIERAARLQSEILSGVAGAVRPGGLLVYLTCSLESEENEAQIDGFLAKYHEFERTKPDCFIFPPTAGTDGGYGARLRRVRG